MKNSEIKKELELFMLYDMIFILCGCIFHIFTKNFSIISFGILMLFCDLIKWGITSFKIKYKGE